MMRWITIVVASALLGACLGSSPPSRFYELTPMDGPSASPKSDVSVLIGPVSLPAMLDRPQLVLRISDHERVVDEFSRWAEPLEQSIPRILADNLGRLLGSDWVGVTDLEVDESPDFVVAVSVTRFDAAVAGNAVLACRWWLMDGDGQILVARSARYSATPRSEDRGDIVAALNATLGDLSSAIAEAVRSQG